MAEPPSHPPDLPARAEHVCTFVFHFGFAAADMVAYLVREGGVDEIWTRLDTHRPAEVSASAPSSGSTAEAARSLFPIALRDTLGLGGGPTRFVAAGLIGQEEYDDVVAALEREYSQRRAQAEAARSAAKTDDGQGAIVEVAGDLGLYPDPSLQYPHLWTATCPGTGHQLKLDSAKGLFYCGYCRRGGGPDELRAFASERRA